MPGYVSQDTNCVRDQNHTSVDQNTTKVTKMPIWAVNDDIVISGISGRFPESDNVEEFMDNLYKNVDMVVEDERRWPFGFLGLPKGSGKLKDISRFDAKFFGISDKEANLMDSQIRIMIELTYEAIWDAGIDPNSLNGTNTGTFIGCCFDEAPSAQAEDYSKVVGYKQTFAARLANIFNLRGPSMLIDTACASSFCAFHQAMVSLRSNQCDRAIVVGINMSLRATTQLQFYKLNMISPDGHCKCLDETANGYSKGEACVVMILQKKSDAKRIYATVLHTKTNTDGFKELGITYPSWVSQTNLIKDTYSESGIDPLQVKFVEAHCTGTQAGDPVEMMAIVDSMCRGRKEPLLIGALKSNIGHTEASSGLCSLTKVIFALENQSIPANLHMKVANPKIEGLVSGILKPITQNTPFDGDLVGLNCFGFGGVNVHAIVRAHKKEPPIDNHRIADHIPRLVVMCGRNEEILKHTFSCLLNNPKKLTRDYLSLLNDISKTSPFQMNSAFKGMRYRGFSILENTPQNTIKSTNIQIKKIPKCQKQIWYVFAGMGSQWPAMAKSFMDIKSFAKSIRFSAQALNHYDIDLLSLLVENDENVMRSPLYSFITIAAIQIALVDLLNQLDIKPDGIVGHSIGELVCAYADGCLTREETIRTAFWRGKCVQQYNETKGMMAAVGMTWTEAQQRCPHNVFAACHNAEDSVTISGDENAIQSFVDQLNDQNVFARKVDSCGIAFHSPLISSIEEPLLERLKQIIPSNRIRSSKWISSTYSLTECLSNRTKYVSPEYFVDNLILPALFDDALKQIPKDAVIVEISPHHLLQPIIKRSLGSDITYIPLMKKNCDNLNLLLSSIGQLYTQGFNPSIEHLYPSVEYPVSRGTHPISPLIKWDHSKSYTVYQYPDYFNPIGLTDFAVKVDLQDKEDSYLSGHCIDGRVLFPATGYLLLAWRQLAKDIGVSYDELPVEFENVTLHRATILPKIGVTKFDVRILQTTGSFVISHNGTIAATGRVFVPNKPVTKFDYIFEDELQDQVFHNEQLILRSKDIYKELRLRGYDYGNTFQCVTQSSSKNERLKASIKWNNNWVTFADCMIQMAILGKTSRGLYLPVRIDSLRCDPRVLAAEAKALGDNPEFRAIFDYHLNIGFSKGLEFRGIKANLAPRKLNSQIPITEYYRFVPYDEVCDIGEEMKTLVEYRNQCDKQAIKVAQKFNFPLEDFLTLNGNKHELIENSKSFDGNVSIEAHNLHLLEFLNHLEALETNQIDRSLRDELCQNLLTLERDLLNQCFNKEKFLRSQLETVIENMSSSRINVLEVNQSSVIMSPDIINLIRLSSFNMTISYTLLHPLPDHLSPDVVNNLQTYKWIIEKSKLPPDLNNIDLVVYEDRNDFLECAQNCVNLTLFFESLWNAVKDNGFVLVICKNKITFGEEVICKALSLNYSNSRKKQIIKEAQKTGFILIATKFDSVSKNALFFRKVSTEIKLNKQSFIHVSDKYSLWIEKLQKQLEIIHNKPEGEYIWLIANDKPSNGIIGFVNCLRKEPNGDRIRCIFDFGSADNRCFNDLYENNSYLNSIIKLNLVFNVFYDNKFGSFRHFTIDSKLKPRNSEHCYLNVMTKGDLSSLRWFEAQHKYWPLGRKDHQVLCYVYYAPLNFRDIMLATGKLPPDALPDDMGLQDCILGLEFSGRDENGNRVMGMVPSKGLATTLVMDDIDFLWPIPKYWSMEEASTVPVAYGTAYYALLVRGKLKRGETVLIHSGSGGVGQAAISICLSLDCQLFITVGSDAKRDFLKREFSRLSDRNFSSSRDISFESKIMRETNGRGVDLILNSLSEDKLQASLRCIATNGRFLEIGKFDLSQNNTIGLSLIMRNKNFHGILLDSLFVKDSDAPQTIVNHKKMVRDLIKEGIKNGTVRPLKRTIFDCDKVEEAFRYMASGKHVGKVVIKIREEESFGLTSPTPIKIPAIPRTVFYPNKSYIIVGGLGGFGLELANWMIERGATKLVLTSRTGVKDPYQKLRIKVFSSNQVKVVISKKDASKLKEARQLVETAENLGPVGGIFNLAMVLSDGLFQNQTPDSFNYVSSPKAQAFANLDKISRQLCQQIDYFVAFSSVSCGRGNAGQTNYGFANSVMERICDMRRADGLHGLAIQWGAIGDVGIVAENMGGNDVIIGGSLPQRIPSCLATLDHFLQTQYSVCSSIIKADLKVEASDKKGSLLKTVAHILGLKDYTNLDSNTTLGELGMDSLMGVEVKQTLERDYELVMSMQDIRKLSVGKLGTIGGQSQKSAKSETPKADKNLSLNKFVFEIAAESISYLNDIPDGKPVIFLPPLEGSFNSLIAIAKRLNRPAIGLNWTNECKNLKTIEETALHFLDVINNKLPNCKDGYNLIGYSFGGVVCYEMSLQLQKRSKRVNGLILLDSSPVQFKIGTQQAINKYNLSDKQSQELEALIAFLTQNISIDYQKVKTLLQNTPIDERALKVSQIFLDSQRIQSDSKTIEFIAQTFSNKLLMLNSYTVNGLKLDNDLLLIRAQEHIINNNQTIKTDYGLSEIITGKCDVVTMKGNHKSFLAENCDQITLLINNYLERK